MNNKIGGNIKNTITEKLRLTLTIEEAKLIKFLLSYGLDKVEMKSVECITVKKLIYVLENKIGY